MNQGLFNRNCQDNCQDNDSESVDNLSCNISVLNPNDNIPSSSHSMQSALNLTDKEIYQETTGQSVVISTLYNYENFEDNELIYHEKNMSEINITYDDLIRSIFSEAGNGFNPTIVNYIWTGIVNFSLSAFILEKYEQKTGITRDKISPLSKIQLYKECNIPKMNSIVKKTFSLNLNEFNVSCNSVVPRDDGSISGSISGLIVLNLYFSSLDIYIRFNLRLLISGMPEDLIGKPKIDDSVVFNFNELIINR